MFPARVGRNSAKVYPQARVRGFLVLAVSEIVLPTQGGYPGSANIDCKGNTAVEPQEMVGKTCYHDLTKAVLNSDQSNNHQVFGKLLILVNLVAETRGKIKTRKIF